MSISDEVWMQLQSDAFCAIPIRNLSAVSTNLNSIRATAAANMTVAETTTTMSSWTTTTVTGSNTYISTSKAKTTITKKVSTELETASFLSEPGTTPLMEPPLIEPLSLKEKVSELMANLAELQKERGGCIVYKILAKR
jgi:hypothetical protein